ncbi:hypothetical protein GCM10020331_022760 [Ectobacillus funiculus]
MLEECDAPTTRDVMNTTKQIDLDDARTVARLITLAEESVGKGSNIIASLGECAKGNAIVLGITGTGGAGKKSSLTDEMIRRFFAGNR